MGNLSNLFDIDDVGSGISHALYKDQLCIFPDGVFKGVLFIRVCKGRLNSEICEGVRKQIIRSAIDGLRGDNMVARMGDILYRVSGGGRSGG